MVAAILNPAGLLFGRLHNTIKFTGSVSILIMTLKFVQSLLRAPDHILLGV